MQGLVYYTRSLLEAENENVVTRSIEYVNMVQQKKMLFRIAPPVIPLTDRDIELENPLHGKYLRYPPSCLMSSCFLATITREVSDSDNLVWYMHSAIFIIDVTEKCVKLLRRKHYLHQIKQRCY